MKVYGHPLSPPSLFVYAVAEYLGKPIEVVTVDLMKNEHNTEDYGKKNPNNLVPTIEEGDFHLFESLAIARYLAATSKKDQTIYPKEDVKARAEIDQTLGALNDFRFSVLQQFIDRILSKLREVEQPAAFMKQQTEITEKFLKRYESHLAGKTFFIHDHLTLIDFFLPILLLQLDSIGFKLDENYPNLKKYYKTAQETTPEIGKYMKMFSDTFATIPKFE